MSSPRILRLRDYRRPEPDGTLLSLVEVCRRLRVQPQVVYALKHHRYLHAVPEGKWLKYLSWEVEALARDPAPIRAANRTIFRLDRVDPQVA
jgi:hypothetical protein